MRWGMGRVSGACWRRHWSAEGRQDWRGWVSGGGLAAESAAALRLGLFQFVEQWDLGGIDRLSGGFQREPATLVDFREGLLFARVAGPFEVEGIADDGGGVDVAARRPGINAFPAFLPDGAKGLEGTFEGGARLFFKLTDGGIQSGLVIGEFAFWDGPGPCVLFFPKGASGVDEEHFKIRMAPV